MRAPVGSGRRRPGGGHPISNHPTLQHFQHFWRKDVQTGLAETSCCRFSSKQLRWILCFSAFTWMCSNEHILHCYCQIVFLPWRNLLCFLTGALLKGVFTDPKMWPGGFKMLLWGNLFRKSVQNENFEPCSSTFFFLFPKNIRNVFISQETRQLQQSMSPPPPWHLVDPPPRDWHVRAFARTAHYQGRRLRGPPRDHPTA